MWFWLRKLTRKVFYRPIQEDLARKMERRLSFLYFFIAWNALAYTGYIYYNRKALGIEYDENETMAELMIRKGAITTPAASIYRFDNISYGGKRVLTPEDAAEAHAKRLAGMSLPSDNEKLS